MRSASVTPSEARPSSALSMSTSKSLYRLVKPIYLLHMYVSQDKYTTSDWPKGVNRGAEVCFFTYFL